MSRHQILLTRALGYVLLIALAVLELPIMYRRGQLWWIAVLLLFALCILYYRWPRWSHYHLATEGALNLGLMILNPKGGFRFPGLYL